MTSILTNNASKNALQALRNVNKNLETTQGRIATGMKVTSGGDNAAYFQIGASLSGDSGAYASINEGLTLTKNSIATAELGAKGIKDLADSFLKKVAFAQGAKGGHTEIENDLNELVKQMKTTLSQSTFNGDDMIAAGATSAGDGTIDAATGVLTRTGDSTPVAGTINDPRTVVTGISRASGSYATTSIEVATHDMTKLVADFEAIATGFAAAAEDADTGLDFLAGALVSTEGVFADVTDVTTQLGQAKASVDGQQEFLKKLVDNIDSGVGSMVEADMESEAARLQALQTQQQLATQALSIANQGPSSVLSLFR